MNKRELKLEKYGITGSRYKELCGFCEQYAEWLDELKYNNSTVKSMEITDMPHGSGNTDATSELAIRRLELQKKCDIIEQSAIQADPDLYQYIIKSTCYKDPLWYLRDVMGMACSQSAFYDARRYFFLLLDKNKKI